MQQGTDEWVRARCSLVTASRVADVCAKTKSGYSASRASYMGQLLAERLTGQVAESYSNAAMQWGTDHEPQARAVYELATGNFVEEVGFVPHPTVIGSGASPDGLVDPDGMLEIKCPNTSTHWATLKSKAPAGRYQIQMQWQMACTGRKWCDFVSFDPRLTLAKQFICVRVERDDAHIAVLEEEVRRFILELDEEIEWGNREYPEPINVLSGG